MIIAIVTVLVLVSIAIIAYPFLAQRPGDGRPSTDEDIAEQIRRARDRVYEEIRALQQEFFLENLTEEEYRAQLAAARQRAASLIKQQQGVQATIADAEETVDEELLQAAREAESAERAEEDATPAERTA